MKRPNGQHHRPGVPGNQNGTEVSSPGSVHALVGRQRSFNSGLNPGATKFAGHCKDAVEKLGTLDKCSLGTDADSLRLVRIVEIERHSKANTGNSAVGS